MEQLAVVVANMTVAMKARKMTKTTGGADQPSPPLHFGWRLGGHSANKPVYLRSQGLTAHMAIIAQSGSGKSFMLGRMIEEIAAKTRARFLILDPNSDFVKFGAVNPDAWIKHKEGFRRNKKGDILKDDAPGSFQERWRNVGFSLLTEGDIASLQSSLPDANLSPISISWPDLSQDRKQDYLGLSPVSHPAEYSVFQIVQRTIWQQRDIIKSYGNKDPEALQRFEEATRALWHVEFFKRPLTASNEWPGSAFPQSTGVTSPQAALSLYGRIQQLVDLGFWDREGIRPVQRFVADLPITSRILCIDLGSLPSLEHGFMVAAAALDTLWDKARQEWTKALSLSPQDDSRCPIFVVIDEAHNLAPATVTSEIARPISEALVRIAMEGRKYGVFLILVTQRPSRLNENLLSQCDNLCLMKMSNPADIELISQRFGFVPTGTAKGALAFKKGQVLLAGALVEQPVCAQVAPRRTVEGGRSLREDVWLTDPFRP